MRYGDLSSVRLVVVVYQVKRINCRRRKGYQGDVAKKYSTDEKVAMVLATFSGEASLFRYSSKSDIE